MTAYIFPSILAGAAQILSLVEGDFFADNGIELRLSQQITAIDRESRVVRTASGHETHWDKLVLATGSYPVRATCAGE
jgi:nitrite reductase (NADH) large subunit